MATQLTYQQEIDRIATLKDVGDKKWQNINPESAARMRLQNRFQNGLDIARYTADIMRKDMDAYDKAPSQYTQSLGCWHGFIGQQKMISIKKHFESLANFMLIICPRNLFLYLHNSSSTLLFNF